MLRDSVIVTDATSQLPRCSTGIFSEATLCNWRLWCLCADYNSSDQKTACRRHELYVSFRELGWQVNHENGLGLRLGTDTKERKKLVQEGDFCKSFLFEFQVEIVWKKMRFCELNRPEDCGYFVNWWTLLHTVKSKPPKTGVRFTHSNQETADKGSTPLDLHTEPFYLTYFILTLIANFLL